MNEMPSILSCTYTDNTSNPLSTGYGRFDSYRRITDNTTQYNPWKTIGPGTDNPCDEKLLSKLKECTLKGKEIMSERRLVKIMIVDPNLNVPVEHAILINEEEKLTDLDDQELFFELDIKAILQEHNNYRTKVVDKDASGEKEVYLKPARIRDLKMIVKTIAEF